MEMILKVYIYPDGKRPIFHEPHLRGIYASEGWFMKLMEENRQFVTKDPENAHLFYLPYSARQLELALYVPESHNLKPLSLFLRDYANMLAAKYPFWNRTHGSDHFLVACHDWVCSHFLSSLDCLFQFFIFIFFLCFRIFMKTLINKFCKLNLYVHLQFYHFDNILKGESQIVH